MRAGLAVWTAVLAPVAGTAADLPEIRARGSLRVLAAETEQPEMFSVKPAARPGFERELLEGWARLQRLPLEVVAIRQRAERLPALLRGDGDVLIGLVDTAERRRQIAFTHEVLPAHHVVVTRAPNRPVGSLEALRAQRVGVVHGTSWAQAISEAGVPAAQTETFTDLAGVVEALVAGRIGATVMSVSNFALVARRTPGLQAGMAFGAPGHTAWGLRKEDAQLRQSLDDYLENVRKTPSWNRLVVEYFGERSLEVLGRGRKP